MSSLVKAFFFLQPLKLATTSTRRMERQEKQRLFLAVGEAFFSEDSEDTLGLSNEALWNDLAATYSSLKAGLQVKNILSIEQESVNCKDTNGLCNEALWNDLADTYTSLKIASR
jgi:hypothetical protein